eukprot:1181009-Prorocentrum_minimum.AAC.1
MTRAALSRQLCRYEQHGAPSPRRNHILRHDRVCLRLGVRGSHGGVVGSECSARRVRRMPSGLFGLRRQRELTRKCPIGSYVWFGRTVTVVNVLRGVGKCRPHICPKSGGGHDPPPRTSHLPGG